MDKLEQYRTYIKQIINKYAQYKPSYGDVETETIFDTEHDHYQLLFVGWNKNSRIYGPAFHMDIKGDKIWIQHNSTEIEIADELVELGVSKNDIVLGIHAPYRRQFGEFAVG